MKLTTEPTADCGTLYVISVISGFSRDIDDICVLLGYYTPFSGIYVQTFR